MSLIVSGRYGTIFTKYKKQTLMINVNFGTLTYDEIVGIAIRITDHLVDLGYVPDCTDTDNEHEFEVQDMIITELLKINNP